MKYSRTPHGVCHHSLRYRIKDPTRSDIDRAIGVFKRAKNRYMGAIETKQDNYYNDVEGSDIRENGDNTVNSYRVEMPQVAFGGRTNAGKTTLLQQLLGMGQQKFTTGTLLPSKRPGSTRDIHLYSINNSLLLADLPGYGYGSTEDQGRTITDYITKCTNLRMVYILVEAKVLVKPLDEALINILDSHAIPWQLVGTKGDKIKKESEINETLRKLLYISTSLRPKIDSRRRTQDEVILTSSKKELKGSGIPDLCWSICRNCEIT
ncbi:P-loop containing nucleoside triphosphate hydrolase protein [Dipodascopsis uninucleata]